VDKRENNRSMSEPGCRHKGIEMRTRLRGMEIAGIQMGIEVPENHDWEWPDGPIAEFVCLPREPEVHIGIRVGDVPADDLVGEQYGFEGWTFEVAACGSDWLLGLSRRGVREQLARFDRNFRCGEVLVSLDARSRRSFPLPSPLAEWIVLHRTVARGGLILHGGLSHEADATALVLGSDSTRGSVAEAWASPRTAVLGRETVLVREEGGELRAFDTPWSERDGLPVGGSTRVARAIAFEESERAFRECMDPGEAAELLVEHAVVPLCDEMLFEGVLKNARRIAERTTVVRLGEEGGRQAPIQWQSTHLRSGFAPPSYAH
jgi:hypothetical protein